MTHRQRKLRNAPARARRMWSDTLGECLKLIPEVPDVEHPDVPLRICWEFRPLEGRSALYVLVSAEETGEVFIEQLIRVVNHPFLGHGTNSVPDSDTTMTAGGIYIVQAPKDRSEALLLDE